ARTENAPNPAEIFGVEITYAPAEEIQKALINYHNAKGGLAGRKIVPVYHTFDGSGATAADVQSQAACDTFTQDNQVAVTLGLGGEVFLSCMAKRGVPSISSAYFTGADDYFARYPLYLNAGGFNYTRMARTLVDGLVRAGYFKSAKSLGVSSIDSPEWRRAIKLGLRPALARHGLPAPLECSVRDRQTDADLSGASADLSACVLRFQEKQVSHVMFLAPENGAAQELLFMRQADSQGYRPRYGLQSGSAPYLMAENVPPSQLHGALGTGWLPLFDVNEANQRPPHNDQAKLCLDIIRKAGIEDATSPNDEQVRLFICESFFLFEASVSRDGRLDGRGIISGAESLGTSVPATAGFGTRLAPDQHDGVVAYRAFAYVDSCECFRYAGPITKTS
ncbi:MAG: hypothetical protein ACREA0_03370, partial [bacterium]